jgi:ABC-type multidrug transport system ATPase subunit
MSGLDPIGRAEVRDLILGLKKRQDRLLHPHHSGRGDDRDWIGLINHGRMVAEAA